MRFLKTHHLPSNAVGATRTEIAIAPKIIIFYPVFFYHQPSGTKGSPKLLMDGDYGSQYGGVEQGTYATPVNQKAPVDQEASMDWSAVSVRTK